jgi:hypothetical protein
MPILFKYQKSMRDAIQLIVIAAFGAFCDIAIARFTGIGMRLRPISEG